MANFLASFAHTAAQEGGYQAKTSDRGNYCDGKLVGTNRGISAPVLADWLGHCPSVAEMRAVTADLAQRIYRQNYWTPIAGDQIGNQSLAELLMDFAINSGTGTAVHHAQVALTALGHPVLVDGAMGPRTLAALNAAPQEALFNAIKAARETLYRSLAAGNANYAQWLNGWLDRLDHFLFHLPAPAPKPVAG